MSVAIQTGQATTFATQRRLPAWQAKRARQDNLHGRVYRAGEVTHDPCRNRIYPPKGAFTCYTTPTMYQNLNRFLWGSFPSGIPSLKHNFCSRS